MKVKPSKYSIGSSKWADEGCEYPQSWIIEGSNDKNKWYELDKQEKNKNIDGKGKSKTFDIKTSKDFYRYLRIHQTGESTTKDLYTLKIGSVQ